MKTSKPTKKTKAQLKRELVEALAGQAFNYPSAHRDIDKASTQHMINSGVIMTLTACGGREIISPVLLHDGLSDETIAAIKAELKRSYDLATLSKL